MKKVWIGLLMGLLPLALACGSTSSAQGNGGSNGAGGNDVPLPEYSYEVPCDETQVTITERYDVTSDGEGGYIRGELIRTDTSTRYYSWTEVENPRDAILYVCDQTSKVTPPPTPAEDPYAEAAIEAVRQDPDPNLEIDCYIQHVAAVDGNRILARCTTVNETVYNKSFSEYDPAEDVDRVAEGGPTRTLITGTRVTE